MRVLLGLFLIGAIASNLSAAEKPKRSAQHLNSIPGITEMVEAKLNAAGINNVNDLLLEGATPQGRAETAARSGLAPEQILKFVHFADLFRVNALAGPAAELLYSAGVHSATELARCSASDLQVKLGQANDGAKVKRKIPTEKELGEWIGTARTLPKVVTP